MRSPPTIKIFLLDEQLKYIKETMKIPLKILLENGDEKYSSNNRQVVKKKDERWEKIKRREKTLEKKNKRIR